MMVMLCCRICEERRRKKVVNPEISNFEFVMLVSSRVRRAPFQSTGCLGMNQIPERILTFALFRHSFATLLHLHERTHKKRKAASFTKNNQNLLEDANKVHQVLPVIDRENLSGLALTGTSVTVTTEEGALNWPS